jgi:outer membrane immunogenic protein
MIVKTLPIALSAVLVAGSALAADMSAPTYKAPVYKAPPPVWSWTGCYLGAHAGGAWSHLDVTDVGVGGASFAANGTAGQTFTVTDSAGLAGGQAGCNYQTGPAVFGIEGDIGWMGLRGGALDPGTASNTTVGIGSGAYGDITGRAGVAFYDALLYAKGGFAFYDGKETFSTTSPGFSATSNTGTFTGWVAGGGMEYHFMPNWTAKVEYLHFGFGSQTFIVSNGVANFPFAEKLNVDTVKAGVNYKF